MRHLLLSIVIFMSGFMPITASASASPQEQYRVPVGVDQMVARGNYSIYVYRNNSWQSAGSLEFDAFLHTRKINLDPFLKPGERPLVRLVQYGGGASHVDSILLGGGECLPRRS
jgi:hypothetical protein